ncbi:chemotaxis protein CheW [Halobacteriaceae archaeon GCM10025711]
MSGSEPSTAAPAPADELLSVLQVTVAGVDVAIEAGWVGAIAETVSVTPVPRTAPAVAGVAAIDGDVTAVIDAAVVFGRPPSDATTDRPVVRLARDRGETVGLLVDEVGTFENVPISLVEPVDRDRPADPFGAAADESPSPPSVDARTSHWFRAVVEPDGERRPDPVGVLDVNYLLQLVATTTQT